MEHYEEVLKLLHDKFGWKFTSSLTTTGKKLVEDTIKALKIAKDNHDLQLQRNGNWFEKLPLHWRYFYYMIGGIIIGYFIHYFY